MTQEIIIFLLFAVAAGFVLRMVYRQFFAKRSESGCAKGCGSCSAVDFDKMKFDKIKKEAETAFSSQPKK